MIKTIRLQVLIFWLLLIAVIIAAGLFAGSSDMRSAFSSGSYDGPILIIDAGHGGADGGASSLSGVPESELNLDISQKMAALSGLTGIAYKMTRDSEEIEYPDSATSIAKKKKYDQKKRVEFINSTEKAVLISVHQNCYPQKSPFGPQSFYAKTESSDGLAVLIQDSMNAALCPNNRRIAMPISNDIYLMKNVKCPAVLVECGFISNPKESELLDTGEYRLKIAVVLISAYLRYTDTKE